MRTIVWLKRDLRAHDHAPLYDALKCGETMALYVYEPCWFTSPEFDSSHLEFVNECLAELRERLYGLNIPLVLLHDSAVSALDTVHRAWRFERIHCHQETGCDWSFQRDKQVITWCKERGVVFQEYLQFAVFRRLKDRNRWNSLRKKTIQRPPIPYPSRQEASAPLDQLSKALPFGRILTHKELNLPPDTKCHRQKGGESQAMQTLRSFLEARGMSYITDISSPLKAESGGSRISPYLAYGALSLTQVHHALKERRLSLSAPDNTGDNVQEHQTLWRKSLWAFENRLWWHCHFIQKLESEPEIEFENVNRAFDGLRESDFNETYFEAWCRGETGYPFIDACMRALHQTGWINFRMRAMLVSFAAYHLWLHWRKPAEFLAKHFLDFEPGIHYSQFQMQSGVTGINAIRMYSPHKQSLDQDPNGTFIRRYCPELQKVPDSYIHQPESLPPLLQMACGFRPGYDYPLPIVDHATAYNTAKKRIYEWRRLPEVRTAAKQVLHKHGSRRNQHFPKQNRGIE